MPDYQQTFDTLRKSPQGNPQVVGLLEAWIIRKDDSALAPIVATRSWEWNYLFQPLVRNLPKPTEYSEEDRRVVRLALELDQESSSLAYRLRDLIDAEPEADQLTPFLETLGQHRDLPEIIEWIDRKLQPYEFGPLLLKEPGEIDSSRLVSTAATRFLLARSDAEIEATQKMIADSPGTRPYWRRGGLTHLPWVFFHFDRARLPAIAGSFLDRPTILIHSAAMAFAHAGFPELESRVEKMLPGFPPGERFAIAESLFRKDPERYREALWNAGLACLQIEDFAHMGVTEALIRHFGEQALDPMIKHLKNLCGSDWFFANRLTQVREMLGKLGGRFFVAALGLKDAFPSHANALTHLIELGSDEYEQEIETRLRELIRCPDAESATKGIRLAGKWHPDRFEADLWGALAHKSKGVREAAARSLSALGEAAIEPAEQRLVAKRAATREAAVTLLSLIESPRAGEVLETRLDEETSDDVRDCILLALEKVWRDQGREPGMDYVEDRLAKFREKGGADAPAWLDLESLPPLHFRGEGGALTPEAIQFLVYRQGRAKEIVPDIELKPLLAQVDRESSGDFAAALLKAYLVSPQDAKDRWALTLAGLLGDDQCVPLLMKAIREWPTQSRHKLAEYAAQALALIGTDAALMAVDSLTIKYRSKYKNIGKAAAESFRQAAFDQGITPEELGDRVVPRLGFPEGETSRVLEGGNRRIRQSIGPDLKFAFFDLEKNKAVKTLPTAIREEIRKQVKEDAATLREVVKAQNLRLENLLVQQYEWEAGRWAELFLHHPVLKPYGTALVWSRGDTTFRALEDGTLTDAEDETVPVPTSGTVRMAHPLNLEEATAQRWVEHLADYEVTPPFPQLERPVILPGSSDRLRKFYDEIDGTQLGAFTFRGRAERLGWVRGSVCDAGCITAYYKPFPGAGADAFLFVEEMWVGMTMEDQMRTGRAFFVKHDSVEIGSYIYDEPNDEKDERLLAFGDVPPLVYSEVISELGRIAGKNLAPAGAGENDDN